MNEQNLAPDDFRQRLTQLREALLHLHKALIDSERIGYEQTIGTIPSANHFLQLVVGDSWFAWLHPLSQLVVLMDEALDVKSKTPLTGEMATALVKQTRDLLVTSESGEGFSHHYFIATQRDPNVIFAHAEAARFFKPQKS